MGATTSPKVRGTSKQGGAKGANQNIAAAHMSSNLNRTTAEAMSMTTSGVQTYGGPQVNSRKMALNSGRNVSKGVGVEDNLFSSLILNSASLDEMNPSGIYH